MKITSRHWDAETQCHQIQFDVPPDLPIFEGHFAGNPVVPGAFQVQWVCDLITELGLLAPGSWQLPNIKFKNLMKPGSQFQLEIKILSAEQVSFRYLQDGQIFSTGKIGA